MGLYVEYLVDFDAKFGLKNHDLKGKETYSCGHKINEILGDKKCQNYR
mgnify:CR=1 FL=1|jgi:hypothetical protein